MRILPEPASVKDVIESCGVPHTQVDLILVNSLPVNFHYLVEGGGQISVYPVFSTIELPETHRLQERTLKQLRFLVDVNLGKLARLLRMAGFDTAYRNHAHDKELIRKMLEENRVLITRDRRLLMHKVVSNGYLVHSDHPAEQLDEVLHRYDLYANMAPFSRCTLCNGLLEEAEKSDVLDKLEPLTKRYYNQFAKCPDCGQVYWAGSHRNRLHPGVKKIFEPYQN